MVIMFYVYLLKSLKNNKSYVGFTGKKPQERLIEHNSGGNNWTRTNKPFELIYWEKFFCKKDALFREKFFKSGQGKKLRKIIVKYF